MSHKYAYWGLGHMSHPEDPVGCCSALENDPVHLCNEGIPPYGHPRDWKYCGLPFEHEGEHKEVKNNG